MLSRTRKSQQLKRIRFKLFTYVTFNTPTDTPSLFRLTWPSMRLNRVPSRSSLQMKKTQSQWGKIFSNWSSGALPRAVKSNKQARSRKRQRLKSSRPPLTLSPRKMRKSQSKSRRLRLHLRRSQNHSDRRASLVHLQMNHPGRKSRHLSLSSHGSQSLSSRTRHLWVIGKNVE